MMVLLLSLSLVLADQAAKAWITGRFWVGQSMVVVPGLFSLTYVRNTGAAWGSFGNSTGVLTLLSAVVLVCLLIFRRAFLSDGLLHRVILALMLGGIAGNLLDRLRLHYVVDFLDFYWQGHHFAVFNIADAAISVGVGLYLLSTFLARKADPES